MTFSPAPREARSASRGTMPRRVATNLFVIDKTREGRRMLFIAVGLTVALVAADLLDLGSRRAEARSKLGS